MINTKRTWEQDADEANGMRSYGKMQELSYLDMVCEGIAMERGTIKDMLNLDYHILNQVRRCQNIGATQVEINQILQKYLPND